MSSSAQRHWCHGVARERCRRGVEQRQAEGSETHVGASCIVARNGRAVGHGLDYWRPTLPRNSLRTSFWDRDWRA